MKAFVEHDEQSNIRSIGLAHAAPGKQARPVGRTGHAVSEVEIPHLKDAGDIEALRQLAHEFRVDVKVKPPALMPKAG